MTAQQSGLTAQQQATVQSAMHLVDTLATRRCRKTDALDFNELQSIGYEKLVELAPTYDPGVGEFDAYVNLAVSGAMLDAVRRRTKHERREGRRVTDQLHPDEPLAEESIEDALLASPDDDRRRVVSSLELCLAGASAAAILASEGEDSTNDRLHMGHALKALRTFAAQLGEPEKTVFGRFYQDERRVDDIAAEVGVAPRTVKRITQGLRARLSDLLLPIS